MVQMFSCYYLHTFLNALMVYIFEMKYILVF